MNIHAERLNRGLTLTAVADACQVARATLMKAEAGERPAPPQAKRIADFYGVKVLDIWPLEDLEPAA